LGVFGEKFIVFVNLDCHNNLNLYIIKFVFQIMALGRTKAAKNHVVRDLFLNLMRQE